jgi:hypothetical protein
MDFASMNDRPMVWVNTSLMLCGPIFNLCACMAVFMPFTTAIIASFPNDSLTQFTTESKMELPESEPYLTAAGIQTGYRKNWNNQRINFKAHNRFPVIGHIENQTDCRMVKAIDFTIDIQRKIDTIYHDIENSSHLIDLN